MKYLALPLVLAVGAGASVVMSTVAPSRLHAQTNDAVGEPASVRAAQEQARARLEADLTAVQSHRPSYPFWQHIFTIPDGRIIFGSAADGRLLASFPTNGDWVSGAQWEDPSLAGTLAGVRMSRSLQERREQVVQQLEPLAGPVLHNPTRGLFLLPNAERYGIFLQEWGTIYERFGVPAEIGLAQAILESGLDGRARSRAQALGLCQWLRRNWDYLNRLTPVVLEAFNQTTQAPYCAAYLSVLTTMYGSFIPALSEHHAGGVNVGRTVINGERLGGVDVREQYLLGSQFAVELRSVSIRRYRELFRTYGLRSALYAEMVFGNTINVQKLMEQHPQTPIFAMRTTRSIPLAEVTRRTGLNTDEVKRFNPALIKAVPAKASLYLPMYVKDFGRDVSFWHRPPSAQYGSVLIDFINLQASVQQWHEPSFESTLRTFQNRFDATDTEEGAVMATVLTYVLNDLRTSRRAAILEDFRTSGNIISLFRSGVEELGATIRGL